LTLEELQIVITANVAPTLRQLKEVQTSLQGMAKTAATVGQQAAGEAQKAATQTAKALQSSDAAEKKSVETVKQVQKQKAQSMEEIAAIAESATKRYNDTLKGMGNGAPINEPVKLTGSSGTATGSSSKVETKAPNVSTGGSENALQRLRARVLEVKQSLTGMFSGAAREAPAVAEAVSQLTAKLDTINAKADIQRRKLVELQAEYARLSSRAGGSGGTEALKLQERIITTQARLQALSAQSDKTAAAIRNLDSGLNETGNAGTRAAKGAERAGNGFRFAQSGSSGFRRELSMMGRQIISMILIYGLLMKALTTLGTYLWSALKTNTAFSNSLNNLKVQFLTAFNPIYQAALPALTSLINAMAKAMSYIAAFVSGFFGKTYAQSKQNASALNDNVKALQDTSKAAKAAKDNMLGIDELNVIQPTSSTDSSGSDKDAALTNADFGAADAKPLISENQIASAEAAGERVRAVFEKIHDFATKYEQPIKDAIIGIVSAFLLFKTITFVSSIVSGISDAFAVLAANPIVAIGLAIAALIAALIVLYNTNSKFRDGINSAWTEIQKIFQSVYDNVIKPITDNIGKIMQDLWTNHIQPLWAQLQVFFGQLAADVKPIVDWLVKTLGPVVVSVFSTIFTIIGDVVGIVIDVVKDVIKIFGGIIDFLAGVFTGDWSKAWKGLQEIFGGIWDLIKDIFSGVVKVVEDLFTGAVSIIESVWSAVVGFFQTIWSGIQQVFKVIGDWFQQIFSDAWGGIKTAWDAVVGFFQSIWDGICSVFSAIGKWFSDTFGGAVKNSQATWNSEVQFFQGIWNGITGIFSAIGNWFGGVFKTAYTNVTTVWSVVTGFFQGIWNGITGVFSSIGKWFGDTFNGAVKNSQSAWNGEVQFFTGIWNGITGVFSSVGTWFSNIFKGAYDGITGAWKGLTGFFQGIWDGIGGAVKGFINGMIGGINTLIDGIDQIHFTTPDWIPGIGGKSFGFGIPRIPFLATGGLAYSETLAVVGDNPNAGSNPEVIAPLDKLKAIINADKDSDSSAEMIAVLNNLLDAVNSKDLSVNLDGRTVAKSVNKANRGMGTPILGGAFAP
jgi:phage-related protein